MNKHKKLLLVSAWALMLPVFAWSQMSFWKESVYYVHAADEDDIEDSISNLQKKLEKEQAEKEKLEQNLGQIQRSVNSTQYEINKTQSAIQEAENNIDRKEAEIESLNGKIKLQKEVLRGLLQQVYYVQSQPVLNVALADGNFSDVFADSDRLLTLEDKVRNMSKEISQTKSQIERDKVELAQTKEEHEDLLDGKVDEKQDLLAEKADVAADVAEQEATIAELQQKLVELQGDLSVLTGNSYDAKDIREAVEYASGKTGVPKGVLYGFLKMETNLGANTGQCTYEQVVDVSLPRYKKLLKSNKKWQASIDLLNKRQDLFYDLVEVLGYSKKKKVSCSPSGYIGQGGAMGVPQFMSDVWKGYSSRITAKTGHRNPDPWNLTDGVMAMAIKLRDAGATSDSASAIKKASISYLGTYYANYYNGIVYWSKNYKRLFN